MHIRRPPPGDGPTIYRPNESVTVRLDPPPRPVAYEPESIPPSPSARESLLLRVNRSRGQILTVMVSIAAIASFGSVVWWAHNQDVKAGGRGLEPLVVQAPLTPSRVKPDNAGGMVPPNQDKEVFNRISPGATPIQPEKLLAEATTPKLPANGMPVPAGAKPATPETDTKTAAAAPSGSATLAPGQTPGQTGVTPPPAAPQPTVTQVPATQPAESGPSIANLIEGLSGPTGGWRVQIASVKSEDVAKSTWARLQSAHGDVLANLRMQAVRVDLGDKGVWYRVQAGPLDEKQAQSVCSSLKGRRADCVTVAPAR
jgi:cell division septation protein DedD